MLQKFNRTKNADVLNLIKKSKSYGIEISNYNVDWSKVIKRSRDISNRLSKGIEFLMKKNKINFRNPPNLNTNEEFKIFKKL